MFYVKLSFLNTVYYDNDKNNNLLNDSEQIKVILNNIKENINFRSDLLKMSLLLEALRMLDDCLNGGSEFQVDIKSTVFCKV